MNGIDRCVWLSIRPGITMQPDTSTAVAPGASIAPTAEIFSPSISTSASYSPSAAMTRPPCRSSSPRSLMGVSLLRGTSLPPIFSDERPEREPPTDRASGHLRADRLVGDRRVVGEEERLAQDQAQDRVVVKRQEEPGGAPVAGRHDAQVAVVGLDQDVAAAEVDPVRAQVAPHHEVALVERAAVGDREPRDQLLDDVTAHLRGLAQLAEAEPVPVGLEATALTAVEPLWVGADRGDADEQVDI